MMDWLVRTTSLGISAIYLISFRRLARFPEGQHPKSPEGGCIVEFRRDLEAALVDGESGCIYDPLLTNRSADYRPRHPPPPDIQQPHPGPR
ncbi:hypothetical protein ANO14919_040910 [Xylariales sp. No.14919]|nr:hypothetical protein ANO14919_040910 [Xylariales sp. No.14919]